MIKKILNCCIVVLLFVLVSFPNMVLAQDTVMSGSGGEHSCPCPEGASDACKQYCGDYEVNDFLSLGVHVSNIILGIVGSLALLAFVAGGLMFLASGGNKTLIDRGKATIIGAVIGLVIVFASYTIISFAADAMGVEVPDNKSIFQTSWFK
ncbi:hypothetical protein KAU09_02785 [Candidatus Parcubacteria bacterium]|nr:hypothetical protein [Candidatus Parcubacteria bacterium]